MPYILRFSPEHLRRLRTRAGLTRTALAYRLDRSADTVGFWERGDSRPRPDFVPRIAAVLGCEVGDLFERIDSGSVGEGSSEGASGDTHAAA